MKKRRKPRPSKNPLPKGAYRLPEGGIVCKSSTSTFVSAKGKAHQLTVTPVYRESPDLDRLAKLLLQLAKEKIARDDGGEPEPTDLLRHDDGPTDSSPPDENERCAA